MSRRMPNKSHRPTSTSPHEFQFASSASASTTIPPLTQSDTQLNQTRVASGLMRLWIKRGFNGTPASIQINSDDLIDDVKDAVFRKYPVALARSYDSPDVGVFLVTPSLVKANAIETKILAVDESITELMRVNFPSGQNVNQALVIQVPNTPRRSPYSAPPRRNPNSPLSGTLGLMTSDMRDFEYFPETPSAGQPDAPNAVHGADYLNSGKNFLPSNYSSASHSSAGFPSQTSSTAIGHDGAIHPAPHLHLNGPRYARERPRPGMGNRQTTTTSSNASTGSYPRPDQGVTLYSKAGRNHRTSSGASHPYQQANPSQPVTVLSEDSALDQVPLPVLAKALLGEERSMSPSVVPLTEQELSVTPVPRQVSTSQPVTIALPESVDLNTMPQSPKIKPRIRRDQVPHSISAAPQRPGLARTLTASKLNMVTPAVSSAHSSTNSVHQLENQVRPKKSETIAVQPTFGVGGLLEGVVPPIVVLIVEDNMINQRILETFMKKRKIRCLTAKNGREAVDKWKKGGVHLVLMDIQMPVMSGIEAAKEIRRLERTNGIGVFSRQDTPSGPPEEADVLTGLHFKSPVIIVALTASSLQSDRHEALAAGCNDFLTKPVSLVWLEKKVLEWGCMQALIDFEGWRQFRGLKLAPKVGQDKASH